MFKSYEISTGYPCDFKVGYKFFLKEEGGRATLPFQGIRFDFWYPHPEHSFNDIFMIWLEFEDENGEVITENSTGVPTSGKARMWIIVPERRLYHKGKIDIGTK